MEIFSTTRLCPSCGGILIDIEWLDDSCDGGDIFYGKCKNCKKEYDFETVVKVVGYNFTERD